jgi:hypothetical protein
VQCFRVFSRATSANGDTEGSEAATLSGFVDRCSVFEGSVKPLWPFPAQSRSQNLLIDIFNNCCSFLQRVRISETFDTRRHCADAPRALGSRRLGSRRLRSHLQATWLDKTRLEVTARLALLGLACSACSARFGSVWLRLALLIWGLLGSGRLGLSRPRWLDSARIGQSMLGSARLGRLALCRVG